MIEQMQKWIDDLDQVTELFTNELSRLTEDQLNWKQSPDAWSIAQVIEHIILINTSYFPLIEEIKSGTYKLPFTAKVSFLVKQFGNIIYKSVARDNRKKFKTMPIWKPDLSTVSGDILQGFMDHQHELVKVISGCEDLLAQGAVISSPANKNIVYKLEKAFDIIVEHEFRHHGQASEIKSLLTSS